MNDLPSAYDVAVGESLAREMVDAIEEMNADDDLGSWEGKRWAEATKACLYDPEYRIASHLLGISGNDIKAIFAWATDGRDGWEIVNQDFAEIVGTALARFWAYG